MKAKTLAVAVPLLLAPLSAHAVLQAGVKAAYWFPKLSGDMELGARGETIQRDLEETFSDESVPFGEVFLRAGSHHLDLAGARFDYLADEGSLKYTMLDLTYQWDLIDLDNCLAGFSLGPIVGVKYVEGDASLVADLGDLGTLREKESFQAPIPVVGLGLHVGLLADVLEARARAVGMAYSGNSLVDVSAELSYNPFPWVELAGGYRHNALDVDSEDLAGGEGDFRLDFRQSGPYVGLALKLGI